MDKLDEELHYEKLMLKRETKNTDVFKAQFIREMKNGLGEEIKKNPKGFKVLKQTWYQKLFTKLKKILTKL
jgi:hypothetical protein